MADSPVTVQRFSWPDLCPALLMFRALPTALSMTVLVLALFAVAATPVGWIAMEKLWVGDDLAADLEFQQITEINRSPYKVVYPNWSDGDSMLTVFGNHLRGVELVFEAAVDSVNGIFSLTQGVARFLYFLGGGLWTLVIWTFFGCAITRAALMRYTRNEPIGIDDAFDWAIDKFLSCFGGVSLPLLAVFGLTIPLALAGLVMATNVGAAIGGLLWGIVLIIALVIAIILLGLMFAWPLIVSAISCEGQDSFDGMSRAFAYVFQRPVHYFAYAVVAVLFSGVCWLVASNLIEGTIRTAHWATSWGTNVSSYRTVELTDEITVSLNNIEDVTRQEVAAGRDISTRDGERIDGEADVPGSLAFGKRMIRFWNNVARTLGAAFLYGLFWSLAAAMYLLLRKDLDDTETDEIYLVEEHRTYELPPLKDDGSGVPQVDTDAGLPGQTDSESSPDESPDH